ncbi:alpha/beta hydrolase family protein [Methanosarcina sp. Mfa9]|uniref:alpha/beta hydrolase family protein n=1 Tax=Methanosarcina sp. Mfa9 TaxID=3439063 RepID=UPI003F84F7C0
MKEKIIVFQSDVKLTGVLRYPDPESFPSSGKVPAVLLNHGTLEHDRDGNMLGHPDGRKLPERNFFLEISRQFCSAGFATFSWDKRGVRESEGDKNDALSLAQDSGVALDVLCAQDIIDENRVVIYGQSAGVYTTCLLAKTLLEKTDPGPCAFILSGGLYRDCMEMIAFNYLRPVKYAGRSPEHRKWVEENDLFGLALGSNLVLRKKALLEGKNRYRVSYGEREWTIPLDPLFSDPEYAPSKQFRYIRKPALIVHGACDLNVPVEDAYMVKKELEKYGRRNCEKNGEKNGGGNNGRFVGGNGGKNGERNGGRNAVDVELAILPGADHSFQEVPADEDERLRERMSLECLRRPYRQEYFDTMLGFLRRVF